MIFWIFPIVPCHAFCMWHWPIGKNLDSSFIWGHHHLIVSIWISVYQLNTSYSLLRRTDETQQGRNSCLRLQMLASVWTLSCHCPVKLLTQYQPCIIVCYSVYFWLNRSFIYPAFTGSIFVCGPLHHHVLLFNILRCVSLAVVFDFSPFFIFIVFFSKQCLVQNFQGKFQKN